MSMLCRRLRHQSQGRTARSCAPPVGQLPEHRACIAPVRRNARDCEHDAYSLGVVGALGRGPGGRLQLIEVAYWPRRPGCGSAAGGQRPAAASGPMRPHCGPQAQATGRLMDRIHPFVRIPGGAPYSDYNTDRGVAEQITAEACRLLVADHDCGLDEEQRFHGTGRIEYESGLVYEGDLAHGRATGRGKLFWPSGEAYEGTVRNGRAWGEGRMEWPNGTTYEGSMLDGKRHGFGVLVAASGVRYEGEWAGGKREGRGRLVYGVAVGPDGQRVVNEYVGQFRADRRHGVGTLRYASGSVYEGEWRDDRKAGQGVMVWPASGQVYKGGWADDQPDGQGVSVWERTRPQAADEHSADASRRPMCTRYEGGFRGGARHGVGTLYYADGAKYTGTWREGLKEGLGVMVSADGAVYEGVFEADRPRDGPQRRSDAPPSPRTTERQTAYSLHVDDVITGALPSVKARGAGSLAGPAGAALAGLSAARAVGGAVLAGGGVVGGRGLALATRRDATATQNVLSRWLPLLRRWYDAACVEGSTAMGGPLEISDGEGKPVRVVMEAGSSVDADGTGAAASEQGRADGRSE
ncbi:rsph10b, partial [Symbiodinium sp. KB8]